jgi:hypothetical protein
MRHLRALDAFGRGTSLRPQRRRDPMSVFILNHKDIDHLVCELSVRDLLTFPAGFRLPPGLRREDVVGRMLWRENLMSVRHGCRDDVSGHRLAPTGFRESDVDTYTYSPCPPLDREDVEELVTLYDCNSRAHDSYWRSAPCAWVMALKEAVRRAAAIAAVA